MPIEIATKEDIKEAVMGVVQPLLQKIEELNKKLEYVTDEYFTEEEVCKILKVSGSTLRRLYKKGKAPAPRKIGIQNRWLKSEILNYLHSE